MIITEREQIPTLRELTGLLFQIKRPEQTTADEIHVELCSTRPDGTPDPDAPGFTVKLEKIDVFPTQGDGPDVPHQTWVYRGAVAITEKIL